MINKLRIPNDVEGRQFIKSLQKYLRSTPYRVSARGRGPRHNGRYVRGLPMALATSFVLYINKKPTVKYVEVMSPTGRRWVNQLTKWHPSLLNSGVKA